jgi:tetratricopeptide (TPR) repeat protein
MKPYRPALQILICFLMLCCSCASARAAENSPDVSQLFFEANQAYQAADYQRAAATYQSIIQSGVMSGHLFYNLGNACLKAGEIGRAILSYRKAGMLMPRSEDLETNLRYALEQTTDKIECRELPTVVSNFCFWYTKLTAGELCAVLLIANALFWALLLIRGFYRGEALTIALYILLFLTLVFGISFAAKLYNTHINPGGVVTARECMVRAGNSINDTVLFKLHEGAEFTWTDENEGWVKIKLCDGKKGWAQKESVEKISFY